SLVLLFFAVIGARAVFALPMALPSNWIFRVTAVHSPAGYFAAVRKSLFALTVIPIWVASTVLYFAIWPGRPALEHVAILVAIGTLLVHRSLYGFRKIPFACSYLPGRANLQVRLGAYGVLFLFAADFGVRLEFWTMEKFARYVVVFSILMAAALWARRRTREFAAASHNRIQFEDLPTGEVHPLDLRRDGAWSGDEAYIDAANPQMERSFRDRAKPVIIGALVLVTAGFFYEQAGAWRDRKRFPQVGRSIDIGGRSLNVYCSGEGSPTVILESGHALPGYSWVLVQ